MAEAAARLGTRSDPGFKGRIHGVLRQPHLVLILQASRPLLGGARYCLAGIDEVLLGRGSHRRGARSGEAGRPRLTITVDCPFMSLEHARLARTDEGWSIPEIRSKNGVYVNGERVAPGTPIGPGDIVTMGHAFFAVEDFDAKEHGDLDAQDVSILPPGLLTLHPTYADTLVDLRKAALDPSAITLVGETGTGKEIVSRTVHDLSGRRGAYVAISCADIPRTLIASELFGYVKGAFSGATRDHPGHFREADRGTLMLDEILSAPMELQVALLRTIQEQKVRPVGGRNDVAIDVRLIAATQQPLDEAIIKHGFRGDLHSRLQAFVCRLPPLRERLCDVGNLVALTLRANGASPDTTLTLDAGLALLMYHWPFNIRELAQALARAKTLATANAIDATHLPRPVAPSEDDQLRKELIAAMRATKGNVTETARHLGRNRTLVHKWLRNLAIDPRQFR